MPPPAMPILPSMVCTMAMVRMFCAPIECWVQPSAYRKVATLSRFAHSPSISHTFRNWSFGVPVMLLTMSGV